MDYFPKFTIIIFFLVVNCLSTHAKVRNEDSLKTELRAIKNDGERISLLLKIGELLLNDSPDSSLAYAENVFKISTKLNFKEGIANSFFLEGKALVEKYEYQNALEKFHLASDIFNTLNKKEEVGNCFIQKGFVFACMHLRDSCTLYLNRAEEMFDKETNKKEIASIENIRGINYWSAGNYSNGLVSCNRSIVLYRQLNDSVNLPEVLNNKGAILWGLSNYENALECFFESHIIFEKQNIQNLLTCNNIGQVYLDWGYDANALEYFQKAEKMIPQSKSKLGIAYTYLNLGVHYSKANEINKALNYLQKSELGYAGLNDLVGVSLCKIRIAECYEKAGNLNLAGENFKKAAQIAEESKNNHRIALAYYHLAKHELSLNNFEKSLSNSSISLQIARKGQYKDVEYLLYGHLSELHEMKGQATKSLEMLKKAVAMKDEIYREKIAVQYLVMELTLENESKEFENLKLKNENDLKEKTIRFQAFTVIMILVLLGAIVVYTYFLTRKKKELQKANETKDKIFSIVSHDLRGPVGNLNNMIDILVNEKIEEDHRKLLHMFKPAITNSYNLLNNLLVWAKSNLGKLEFKGRNFELEALINETILPIADLAAKKSITINYESNQKTFAFADKMLTQTILRNLLNNAIKFTSEKGIIKIFIEESGKNIVISVKDNGVGISKKNQSVMFKTETHTLGTNRETGSGLGLMLCRELSEKNGGSIWFTSRQGEGSTFSFSVPKGEAAN